MSAVSAIVGQEDQVLEAVRRHTGSAVTYAEPPVAMKGGRDTEVFTLRLAGVAGDLARPLVLRVFRPGEERRATFEAILHRLLHEAGLPVPAILLEGATSERPWVLMERVPGRVAGAYLLPPSRTGFRVPRLMAETAAALHALDAASIAAVVAASAVRALHPLDETHRRVARLGEAGDRRFDAIAAWLDANAPPRAAQVLCHGDFHPWNVLIEDGAISGIIDWANFHVAPAEYDLARSVVILTEAPVSLPLPLQSAVRAVRRPIARSYLAHYRRLRPINDSTFDYWLAFAATAMLVEGALAVLDGRTHPWREPVNAARLCRRIEQAAGLDTSALRGAA